MQLKAHEPKADRESKINRKILAFPYFKYDAIIYDCVVHSGKTYIIREFCIAL
jgi:hypothetical protein